MDPGGRTVHRRRGAPSRIADPRRRRLPDNPPRGPVAPLALRRGIRAARAHQGGEGLAATGRLAARAGPAGRRIALTLMFTPSTLRVHGANHEPLRPTATGAHGWARSAGAPSCPDASAGPANC